MRSQWNSHLAHHEVPVPAVRIPEALRLALPEKFRLELDSIQRNDDAFFSGEALQLARRLQSARNEAPALQLFQFIAATVSDADVKRQAEAEIDALLQTGSGGWRVESAIGRLAQQACDYRMIAPMLAGSAVGQLAEALAVRGLANGASLAMLSRGAPRSLAAAGLALSAETTTFVASAHLLNGSTDTWHRDLTRAALGLGIFKLSGSLGRGLLSSRELGRHGIGALSQYGLGILEVRLGLRDPGQAGISDALASYLTMSLGSHLGGKLLGNRIAGFGNEIAARSREPGNFGSDLFAGVDRGVALASAEGASNIAEGIPGPTRLFTVGIGDSGGSGTGYRGLPGTHAKMESLLDIILPCEAARNAKIEAEFQQGKRRSSGYLNQADRIAAAWKYLELLRIQAPNSDAFIHASSALLERMAFPDFDGKATPENFSEITFRNGILKILAQELASHSPNDMARARWLESTLLTYRRSSPEYRFLLRNNPDPALMLELERLPSIRLPILVGQVPSQVFSYEEKIEEQIRIKFQTLAELHQRLGGSVDKVLISNSLMLAEAVDEKNNTYLKHSMTGLAAGAGGMIGGTLLNAFAGFWWPAAPLLVAGAFVFGRAQYRRWLQKK